MHKPPVGLTSINFSRPRQKEVIALIKERPRTKAELIELMKVKKGNLEKVLQTLISKGEIVPNLKTGKYEIYAKPKKSAAEKFAAVEIEVNPYFLPPLAISSISDQDSPRNLLHNI